jgi:hypothetical protein
MRAAQEFVDAVTDKKLRHLLQFAFITVITRRGMDPAVEMPDSFDMRFFFEAVKAVFADEAAIRLIIDGRGEELRWGPPWEYPD